MRKGKDADHRVCSGRGRPSRAAASRARHLVTVLLALALAAAGATAALAQEPGSAEEKELGRLFTQTANRGTLKPVKGKPRFTLKLRGVAPQVVWFDDRPERQTGQMPVGGFVRSWAGFGFRAVPPNAALTLLDAKDHQDTVVLKLGNPRYDRKTRTVRYPAHVLDAATGNLSHLEPQRDGGVPRRFRAASLFIDDAGYGLPAGCQPGWPYIKCTYTSSTTFSFDEMHTELERALGRTVDSSTPAWVEAWGGRGAAGASGDDGFDGGSGGYAGYANSVSSVGTLGGETLYLYVGQSGSKHANYSGQGGGSTIVSTQAISRIAQTGFPGGVQVIAGGSGGGAKTCDHARGGAGGVAVAAHTFYADQAANGVVGAGQSGQGSGDAGGGGSAPAASSNPSGAGGEAGTAGDSDASPGTGSLGGYGGQGGSGSIVGWVNLDAVDPYAAGWTAGAGGRGRGGGGGGGFGGGGGAGLCGGGGGGGSWARTIEADYSLYDDDAPSDSKQGDGAQSEIVLTFHLSPP